MRLSSSSSLVECSIRRGAEHSRGPDDPSDGFCDERRLTSSGSPMPLLHSRETFKKCGN